MTKLDDTTDRGEPVEGRSSVETARELGDDSLLRDVLGMSPRRAAASLAPGMVIDAAYEIGEELGEGGMGRVYRARDLRLGRDLAIKLHTAISVEPGGDRLRREATALARLTHPNVVTVYEVGTWGDHPWVAMEYVLGGTARSWLRAASRTPREILALYLAAGRGLAAAHAAGLVHRDFKPDNVLVGDDGRICVADFGLARDQGATDPSTPSNAPVLPDITRTGTVMGTPAYMAPEQRTGEVVGPAADQFAFAIALWEALSGERPFAGETEAELAAAVASHQIQPPARRIDRRIERALRRALEVDPEARWPSMTALLAELSRDRSRQRAAAIAIAGVVLAIAGTGALVLRREAVVCAATAADTIWTPQRRDAVRAALGKHASAGDVTRVVAFVDDWVGKWRDQRVVACEATHERATQSPELLDLRNFCLDRAGVALEATLGSLEALPADAIDRASELAHALPRLEDCADVPRLSGRAPPPSDPAVRERLATLTAMLARVKVWGAAGDFTRSLVEARTAVALADSLGPASAAEAQLALAGALYGAGDTRELLATYERAAHLAATARDDDLVAKAWIAALETVALRLEKPGEADRLVATAEAAVARAGDRPELRVGLLRGRGDLLALRDDHRGALAVFHQALAIGEPLYGVDSDETRPLLHRLANAHLQLRELDRARALLARVVAIVEQHHGPRHRDLGVLLTTRGGLEATAGDFAAARVTFEQALAHKEQTLGKDHAALLPTLVSLADVLEWLNEIDAAKRYAMRAIALAERSLGPEHPKVAQAYGMLAGIEMWRGDWVAAEQALARATAIEATGEELVTLSFTLAKLARARVQHGDFDGGRKILQRALRIATKPGPETMEVAMVLETLGNLELSAGDLEAAEAALRRAKAIVERVAGKHHPVFQRLEIELSVVAH